MFSKLKNNVRKIVPDPLLRGYHFCLAQIAAAVYGYPSKKMYVIGITGTKGKTSTANFIWSVLSAGSLKTGLIGTANIRIGEHESLNKFHMTMPGPFVIQKLLAQMYAAGCTHIVMEVTSEGIKLFRHIGIVFDCAIFTNLTPEHLPSHDGNFQKYKKAKGQLFASLMNHAKHIHGKYIKRTIIANNDDEHKNYFLGFPADLKVVYGTVPGADWLAENIIETNKGIDFVCKDQHYQLSIIGKFNVYNALPALVFARVILNISEDKIREGLTKLQIIPGRMEKIDCEQNFTVIVDYAHEKVSMNAVLDTAKNIADGKRVIILLGAEGGGRDKAKRAQMGEAVGKKADYVICSNVDPYDDNPAEIVEDIARVAEQFGKVRDQNLFVIEDRRAGIAKALSLAQAGDVIIITGKGAEQSMVLGNKKIPWDDREVVREELSKLKNN